MSDPHTRPLSAPELATHREEIHRAFSKADAALARNTITQAQRDGFLTQMYGSKDEREALDLLQLRATANSDLKAEIVIEDMTDEEAVTKRAVHESFTKLDRAVAQGTITVAERDAYLRTKHGHTERAAAVERVATKATREQNRGHDPRTLVIGFAVMMVAMLGALFWLGGGITGAVIQETTLDMDRIITETTDIPILLDNTDAVGILATAYGAGDILITLDIDGEQRTIAQYFEGRIATVHGSLEQRRYVEGETVTIQTLGEIVGATLVRADGTEPIDPATFARELPIGSYVIVLLAQEGDGVIQEELPFTVVAPDAPLPNAVLTGCGEACALERTSGSATLRITIVGDATLNLSNVILTKLVNTPPVFSAIIPDQEGAVITIDLADYFTDADGDALLYETSHPAGATETLNGSVLTISGRAGTYTYIAYASDLAELVESNAFTVTIMPETVDNTTTNATLNATEPVLEPMPTNETEPTINESTPVTPFPETSLNETNLTIDECANADPNLRPVSCLNVDGGRYFEEEVLLETTTREARGRITPIGNLLITGRVIESSTGSALDSDYRIGHNDDFAYVPTIWIDAAGNLNLRGQLHEENENLVPPPGSHALMNRRGVYMMWADPVLGDLYLRGNVISYRTSVYE